jgi:hypothetical protein
MNGIGKMLGVSAAAAVALILVLSGLAAASGSGYNLSYSQSSTTSPAAVAMDGLTTSYSSGPNLTTAFTAAGALDLSSSDYVYYVWFGGSDASNSTADAYFSNNTTAGFYIGYSSNAGSSGYLNFQLSNGGATLTFSIATALVGPASTFAVDVEAVYVNGASESFSWLGTDYQPGSGGGGGVSCTGTSCTVNNSPAASIWSGFLLYAVLGIVIVVVVIVVILMLVLRKKPRAPAQPPMQGGWMPPGQPGMAPPPPQYQPMAPPPPPPPPPGA